MEHEDEILAATEQWLHREPLPEEERVVITQEGSHFSQSPGIQATLEYAVLASHLPLVPASGENTEEHEGARHAMASLNYAVQEPRVGLAPQENMTATLTMDDGITQTVAVPVHIAGHSTDTVVIRYDPEMRNVPAEDQLAGLIYSAIRHSVDEDEYDDAGDLRWAREGLQNECRELAGSIGKETGQAFLALLRGHVAGFESAMPWPEKPCEFLTHDGRILVRVAAATPSEGKPR